jgi:glutamyl-Q tRNA(Asp) synthetase
VNLPDLRARFRSPPISRFAPAPTGHLHLGHILNAIFVWGVTRALSGRVLLRIEDHDRHRCRREYETGILEDLAWLGFAPDERPVFQRDRDALYQQALERLREQGLVYACECSRATIAAAGGTAGNQLRYPGICAGKGLRERFGRGLRVRLGREDVAFDDLRHGRLVQRPAEQCGDLLVKDREGQWTYQFAATVDDLLQGITLIVRGDDLVESTGRQILLARLLGRGEPPLFLHHALVMKTATQKLSKSDNATAVASLRAAGVSAPDVIGRAAALAHLIPTPTPVRAADVSGLVSG